MTSRLSTVLFDMDGLLVDTEPQWFAAETKTAEWLGIAWTEADQHALFGSNLPFAADYMLRASDLPRSTTRSAADVSSYLRQAMTCQLLDDGVTLRSGASELVSALGNHGLQIGLVTSSVREHVEVVLTALPQQVFGVTVTADDVTRLKPDPLPYLQAMAALGSVAAGTVVLEDSPTGVAAAEAAGCRVVVIPSVTPIADAPGRHVTASLDDVDLDLLHRLVNAR